ncbi:MAG: TonB-dependent receptor, partial [Gemmatimonadota bacterium]|nr:TonB-dependent receptor [Gemmatimonadota bacterium]
FAAVNNLRDVRYVGSVTVNGAGGRVLEPAPGRNFYVGVETGWRVVR